MRAVPRAFWHGIVRRGLEGQYAWGRIDVARSPQSLCASYRLVVYPPGTNPVERRRLIAYRNWPVGGALLAMTALVATGTVVGEVLATTIAAFVYVTGFVVLGRLSRSVRDRCRRVDASFVVQVDGTMTAGNPALLAATVRRFHALELAHRGGGTSAAQFEARWADVYNSLDPAERASTRDR